MCHERWALHVVIKRKFFYIYIQQSSAYRQGWEGGGIKQQRPVVPWLKSLKITKKENVLQDVI